MAAGQPIYMWASERQEYFLLLLSRPPYHTFMTSHCFDPEVKVNSPNSCIGFVLHQTPLQTFPVKYLSYQPWLKTRVIFHNRTTKRFIGQQQIDDDKGTREVHKWLGSEVDWALPWMGRKPSPEADLSTGVQSWLTVSLWDQRSLPALALALRRGRLPSLSAFTNCFTSCDSAWLAPGPPPPLARCRLGCGGGGAPSLLFF